MAETHGNGIAGMIGSSVGEAAAFAAGLAISPALDPLLQALKNETWPTYPDVPLEPEVAAEVVAEGLESEATGASEAALTGTSATRFNYLVDLARKAPGVSEAQALMRRVNPETGKPLISTDMLHLAYRKAKIDPEWFDALDALLVQPLPPAVAALAVVRGLIPDEGTLPVSPPTEVGKIPAFPVYPISGKAAAAAVGLTEEAYAVMVGINGRPMSLHEAASAYFRGIIELSDYQRAVSEGDTRNEWRDAILEQAREIITAHDAIENTIRGYSDEATMFERTARHGMSEDDTRVLFQNAGRPLVAHQITTALARGAKFNPEPGEETDPYNAAVRESNVKPSYYEMWIANRYSYPPLFQLTALVKAGAIDAATAADWANKNGLAPEVVTALTAFWKTQEPAPSGTTPVKPVKLTQAQIRAAWREGKLTDADAIARLGARGVSPADAQLLLETWKQALANTSTSGGTP